MAKYTIPYICGHSGTVNLIGPHRSRESRLAYLERGECFDCYKQHSTEVSREQAKELELPALVGTEKQIAWAETLRIEKFMDIEAAVERLKDKKEHRQILMAVGKISNETSAKRWIEWRYDQAEWIIADVLKAMKAAPTDEQKQQKIAEQQKAEAIQRVALVEATIRPKSAISEMAAEIHITNTIVSVAFSEKRDDFREIVKPMGYTWHEGQWQRIIGNFAGNVTDRAVELGHTLLSHGFLVRVFDEALREKIIAGTFESEQTRWITKRVNGAYAGWLAIQWSRNEDYYRAARKLKNSKYSSPHVVVPPAQFEQVLDFAQMYDFRLSQAAQEAIQQAKEDKAKMLVVTKEPLAKREKIVVCDTPPVLLIPDDIDIADELKEAM
jgi:hypothetical protein